MVEQAVRHGRTDLETLRSQCRRGRSGSAALRRAVDDLSKNGIDRWMRRLVVLLVERGMPTPLLEYPVSDANHVRAFLDGYFPDALLAVEVDDWETHGGRSAQERDRQRDRWLLNAYGIITVRTTPREIRRRPERVVADIARAYQQGLTRRSTEGGAA